MKTIYNGQIEITKLKCIILEKKGQTGMVRGVFIPIELNILHEFLPGRISIPISIVVRDEIDEFGNDGFIGRRIDTKKYKESTEEQKVEFLKLPILGNFKNFSKQDGEPIETISETDDLPF